MKVIDQKVCNKLGVNQMGLVLIHQQQLDHSIVTITIEPDSLPALIAALQECLKENETISNEQQ